MTFATLVHPMRGHDRLAPTFISKLHDQWSRDRALWRSIATGLGMAALGLLMAGSAFGLLTP